MTQDRIKKTKLAIYLIKEDYTEIEKIVLKSHSHRSFDINDTAGYLGTVFVDTGYRKVPKWASFFDGVFDPEEIGLKTNSARALFVVRYGGRHLCLSFGHGHFLIEPLAIERNFGLKVALNQGGQSSIRAVDKTSIDVVEVQGREQSSRDAEITTFAFDVELDILKAITAKGEDGITTLSGRDAINLSASVELDGLRELIGGYLNIYSSEAYKVKFAWVDNVTEERDKAIIESLNGLLVDALNDGNIDHIWMSIPEIIHWEYTSGFAYKKRNNPSVSPDIHLSNWLAEIVGNKSIDLYFIKRKRVLHYDVNIDLLNHWSVYRCLNVEINHRGRKFILNDGSWYSVETSFVDEVNGSFESIPESQVNLPPSEFLKEPEYNKKVANYANSSMCLMEAKNIPLGGGHSRIEFCDLIDNQNRLIHVKKYGGSSVLSHLFQQGLVSGEAFLSDPDFREKVNKKLDDGFKFDNPRETPKASDYEICFAIMSDQPGELHLPFFSKVVLKNVAKRLRTFGYRVTKKKIELN